MDVKLDDLDLKIIQLLHQTGRASLTELSERTGAPRQTISNRLNQLLENGLLSIKGGLDIRKIGYKVSDIGLEVRGEDARRKVEKILRGCPRIMDISRTPGKANFHVRVWGEDDSTINSTIESFGDIRGINIVYTYYLGTPIHGNVLVGLDPSDQSEAPCGMVCGNCSRYHNMLCVGCPTTKFYRNPLHEGDVSVNRSD